MKRAHNIAGMHVWRGAQSRRRFALAFPSQCQFSLQKGGCASPEMSIQWFFCFNNDSSLTRTPHEAPGRRKKRPWMLPEKKIGEFSKRVLRYGRRISFIRAHLPPASGRGAADLPARDADAPRATDGYMIASGGKAEEEGDHFFVDKSVCYSRRRHPPWYSHLNSDARISLTRLSGLQSRRSARWGEMVLEKCVRMFFLLPPTAMEALADSPFPHCVSFAWRCALQKKKHVCLPDPPNSRPLRIRTAFFQ